MQDKRNERRGELIDEFNQYCDKHQIGCNDFRFCGNCEIRWLREKVIESEEKIGYRRKCSIPSDIVLDV